MESYNPLHKPDPDGWLALDEGERILLIANFHEEEGVDLPNVELHASIHAIVENQIAMGDPPQVLSALERLLNSGLDRHDAIHAIGSALSEQLFNAMKDPSKHTDINEPYVESLEELTAEKWLASGEE